MNAVKESPLPTSCWFSKFIFRVISKSLYQQASSRYGIIEHPYSLKEITSSLNLNLNKRNLDSQVYIDYEKGCLCAPTVIIGGCRWQKK